MKNVTDAFQKAIDFAADWIGITGEQKFELNTDFDIARLDPQERSSLIAEWQAGAITFEEMRAVLRKAGVATLDDDEAKLATQTELLERQALSELGNDQDDQDNQDDAQG